MNDSLMKPRPYDFAKDFAPITLSALYQSRLSSILSYQSLHLLAIVTLVRSKPRQLSYGSSGGRLAMTTW